MSWLILEFSQRTPSSKTVESLLTSLTHQGIPLKHMKPIAKQTIQVQITVADYYKLRALIRESGCTWRIKKRTGFAFLPNRIRNRLFFFVGAALFLTSIFVLSSIIWQVEVDGDTKMNHVFIKALAKSNGLYVGQWKQRVQAPEEIAKKMEAQLPEVAWIGVTYVGTKIRIHVIDRTIPDKPIVKPPQHITATNDAVITEVRALKGTPVVRPNDRVIRGMILISGMVGDEEHAVFVPAEGTVRGIVWYMQTIVLPLKTTDERLTGRYLDQSYIRLFGRDWKIKGFNQNAFKHHQTSRDTVHFHFLGFRIETPIVKQRMWQTEHIMIKRSIAQARAEAIDLAGQNLLRKLDKNAVIRERKLLHENVSGGKVYIKVHVEVEQAITKETEIIDRSING